jgi:hypothetical protein
MAGQKSGIGYPNRDGEMRMEEVSGVGGFRRLDVAFVER